MAEARSGSPEQTWNYIRGNFNNGTDVTKTSPEVTLWLLLDLDERLRKLEG